MTQFPALPASRPTHVRYVVLTFLCLLAFLSYFDRVCISGKEVKHGIEKDLLPTLHWHWGNIAHEFDSKKQMGVILGVFWLAYALFEMPGGWLGDRYGARSSLTRVVLAWSIFTALSGLAVGFYSLLTYRFLFGVGEAGAFPIIARVQSRWLPASAQARVSAVLWLVARWGGALAVPLFGMLLGVFHSSAFHSLAHYIPLLDVHDWRLGFWTCGLAGIVWLTLFYSWFRDNPADKPTVNQAELELISAGKRPKPRAERNAAVWKALFTSPNMWGLAMLYGFGSFGFSLFVSNLPDFLATVEPKSAAKSSEWLTALPLFCGGVTCLVGGIFSDMIARRLGRKRLARAIFPVVGHLIAAVSIFSLREVHYKIVAITLLSLTMAAYDFGLASKWAAIIDVGGVHAGLAAGFVNMVGNLCGNCLQPIIAPWIIERYTWHGLLALYAVMYLLAASTWFFINPDRHFYPEDDGAKGTDAPGGFEVMPKPATT